MTGSSRGLWQAGATLVPINTRFKGAEAADVLKRSGARALVTATDFLGVDYVDMLRAAGAELHRLKTIVVSRGPTPAATLAWEDFVARADGASRTEVGRRAAAVTVDDPSDIMFTSGTTGPRHRAELESNLMITRGQFTHLSRGRRRSTLRQRGELT